ncbi:DUF3352 domain-containing protein [Luteococcus sp. OSA5]|uniref:DUF3352 domain-containing protein n=1 Tax=Luteococcus sp. OSA5 TaxID=3401630 RepID=UPI003B439C85
MTENHPSDFTPPASNSADAPVAAAPGQFEPAPAKKSMGKGTKAGLAGLALLLAAGGGIAIADPFDLRKDGAESAAAVLPADAVGYAEFNSNPELSQKAEMVRFAMKFPGLKKKVSLTEDGDLKQELWDSLSKDGKCSSINYEADIKPWIGDRVAVAVRDGAKDPIVAIQAKDEQQARDGVKKINECSDNKQEGVAWADGFLLMAKTQAEADKAVTDAESAPLADKAEFTEDMEKVGKLGLVNFWGTKEGLVQLSKENDVPNGLGQAGGAASKADVKKQLEDATVRSGAGTLRFADGNPEMKVVAKNTKDVKTSTSSTALSDLPADTTVALGISNGAQLLDENWAEIEKALEQADVKVADVEKQMGISLPEDLKTLLGEDMRVAVGPLDKQTLQNMQNPSELPVAIASKTDKTKLTSLVDKIGLADAGAKVTGDDVAVVALNDEWSGKLAKPSETLEKDAAFKAAFAMPEQAQSGIYVNVDKLKPLFTDSMDAKTRENVEPLQAVGITSHVEDANYSVSTARVSAK